MSLVWFLSLAFGLFAAFSIGVNLALHGILELEPRSHEISTVLGSDKKVSTIAYAA